VGGEEMPNGLGAVDTGEVAALVPPGLEGDGDLESLPFQTLRRELIWLLLLPDIAAVEFHEL
jgi:hypothetical protein